MSSAITTSDSLRAIASTKAIVGPRISKSSPLASQQEMERYNEVDPASPVAFRPQEPLTVIDRVSDTSPDPILQIKIAITEAYHRIREEVKDFGDALSGFKHPTIRNQLLPRLKNHLDEEELTALCDQSYSHLNEFSVVGNKLSSYIESLKEIIQKVEENRPDRPSEVQLFIIVNRPKAEIEGRQIMKKLKKTLHSVSLAVNILILSVKAATSQEEMLQKELSQMQDRLASVRRRGSIIPTSDSSSDRSTVQLPPTSSQPAVDFEYLDKRGYSPSSPYQDVPQAYSKRYKYLINCALPESTMWLFHDEEFLDWVYSPSIRVLSCVGPCGTGKSVISAKVVDWLQQASFQRVYFHLGVSKVQTATGVALALLAQLRTLLLTRPLSRSSPLVKSPQGIFFKKPATAIAGLNPTTATAGLKSFSEKETSDLQEHQVSPPPSIILDETSPDMLSSAPAHGEQFLHEVDKTIESWKTSEATNEDELPKLLKQVEDACQHYQDKLFIVLDGWDDDNMVNPDEFRLLLSSLLKKNCRIFLTSRSEINGNENFSVARISLDVDIGTTPQQEDIMRYTEKLLQDSPEGRKQLIQYKFLPKIISNASKGRFDMVRIMTRACVSILEQPSRIYWPSFQVKNHLEHLASTGKIIQQGSLFGSPASKEKEKDLLLGWLVVSPVPLTKTMLHMFFNDVYRVWKFFLEGEPRSDTENPESQHHDSTDGQDLDVDLDAILQSCEPFVTIDHGNDVVQFNSVEAGEIVLQYILENERLWLGVAVAVATTYLDRLDDTEDFAHGLCVTEEKLVDLLGRHTFLYQAAHLARYLSLLVETKFRGSGELQEKFVKLLNSPKIRLLLQISLYTEKDDYNRNKNSWGESMEFVKSLSQLHIAALWGQLEPVMTFLKADNSSAAKMSTRGSFPLHEAAKSGVLAVIDALLQACPDIVHKADNIGNTPLVYAHRGGHKNAIIALFEARCSSQLPNGLEDTIYSEDLHITTRKYCLAKSDLEGIDDDVLCMDIVLLRAVESGLDRVAKFLVDKGANANRDFNGTTALSLAVQNSKDELAEIFVSKNTDPTAKLADGQQPMLHGAVERRMRRTVRKLLDSEKLDINCRDANQRTALFSAIEVGDEEWAMLMTSQFLSRGLRVDDRDKDKNHILHVVAEKGYRSVFSEILFASRYIEEPENKDGKTPFDIAVKHKHKDIVTYLRPTYKFDEL